MTDKDREAFLNHKISCAQIRIGELNDVITILGKRVDEQNKAIEACKKELNGGGGD